MECPRLPYLLANLLFLFAVGLDPVPAHGQEVQGVVLSDRDRTPIEFAAVKLTDLVSGGSMTQLTNHRGAFSVVRAPGRVNLLEVSALGYRTHVDTVYLAASEDSLTLEVRLGVDAIPMEPLVVVASKRPIWESTQPKYLWEFFERAEFYGRRRGTGRFYDREALDLRFGTGGSMTILPTLRSAVSHLREMKNRCSGEFYFLDGVRWRGDVREIPWGIGDLAAVEVYDGGGPLEIGGGGCSTVVMWTQRPVAPEGVEEESGWLLPVLAFLGITLAFAIR